MRVLIVDDSLTFREELRERLGEDGYTVLLAATAAEGIARLENESVDVILMDFVMPGMNGDEACRIVKGMPGSRTTPVILITAREDQATLLKCFEAGADDFITKSSEYEVIRARLVAQLRRKQLEDENQRITEELAVKSAQAAQAEQMRELYGRARAAIEARDEFLSIASHELKTPLTSLKLHVQGLMRFMRGAGGPAPLRDVPASDLEPRLRSAEKQIRRLTRIIEDLLDVARIRGQKMSFELKAVNAPDVIRAAVGRLMADACRDGCEILLDLPESLPAWWDEARIEQVVTNLVMNALKYGPGRPIEVRLGGLGEGHAPPGQVELVIRDHGIGIPQKDQARIFRRFERAVSASHFGGLGLGLFIAEEIVRGHGGRIRVESSPGAGAAFVVTLPADSRLAVTGPDETPCLSA